MTAALLLTAIFTPFAGTPILYFLRHKCSNYLGLISAIFYAISFGCIAAIWTNQVSNQPILLNIPWVPKASINLSFLIDGLSLFFGFLVSSVGILVNVYANYYMDPKKEPLSRFYFYLNLFTTAMLGTVFANNLLLMFMFWEMTGFTSFLLIGYYYQDIHVVKTSRSIFLLTSLTALCLLMGVILLGSLNQSFEWTEIVKKIEPENEGLFYAIIICFLIGIFGKSAQIPFHFWLPKAMVAPTPVSAYLHAATMVKLGVFLTARMFPLFVNHPLWFPALTIICYSTMLLGAILSLLSNDMKALLAYATVSQLGFFIGFYGMGDELGVSYDFLHILNHAFYKGSLFMLAGIIAHATGIRDIRYLGGLWKTLPLTMVIFFIATAAMIGIPGTTGFMSKELVISDLVMIGQKHYSGILILVVLVTSLIVKVAFSIRFFTHIFAKPAASELKLVHKPGIMVHVPALILCSFALFFGIWPKGIESLSQSFFVSGLHKPDAATLGLWHGWTIELAISLSVIVLGTLLFIIGEKTQLWWMGHSLFDFGEVWSKVLNFIETCSKKITEMFFSPRPDTMLMIVFSAFVLFLFPSLLIRFQMPHQIVWDDFLRLSTVFLMIASTISIPFVRKKISKLIALSCSGFFVTLFFVLFHAPDLAMTQLLVEVVTVFIVLALFWIFKGKKPDIRNSFNQALKLMISIGTGLTAALVVLRFHGEQFSLDLKNYFLEGSIPLAKASNVVNAILVDFRGFDTLGEITVLLIATTGVIGLLVSQSPPWKIRSKEIWIIPSNILEKVVPCIFFIVNIFSLYLLLRGHNLPGGGFIAGLASGISFILLSLGIGQKKLSNMIKIQSYPLCLLGFLLSLISCVFPLAFRKPFLTHQFFSEFMNTQLLFESGIFIVVLGMSTSIVFSMRNTVFGRNK